MKRLFVILPLLLLPAMVWAQTVTVNGLKYEVNTLNYTATVAQQGTEAVTGAITIPSTITVYSEDFTVTSIGRNAFNGCTGLTSITIGNSVTSIGDWAFYGCNGLTSISIPNSVTSIGDWAFEFCEGLTSIDIPNSVKSIGRGAFLCCTGLTSITIPNSVTSIGDGAFGYCTGLTSIDIPNSVTSIGNSAFGRCGGLTSITIPNSVTSIGDAAFGNCNELTNIYAKRTNPAAYKCKVNIDGKYWTFYNIPSNCTLHVPRGCASKYRNTAPWNQIKRIVEY